MRIDEATIRDVSGGVLVGQYRDIRLPNPPAGKDWKLTLEGGYWWQPQLIAGTLTTVGGAETRQVFLQTLDGDGNVRGSLQPQRGVIAGATNRCTWQRQTYSPTIFSAGDVASPMWPIWLPAGWALAASTLHLEATDQWTNVQLWLAAAYDDEPGRAPGAGHADGVTWDQLGVALAS